MTSSLTSASKQNKKNQTKNYREMVIEEDTLSAKKLFNSTNKHKQECHTLFMKSSWTAQTRGDFCGLASIASSLHHLNQLNGLNDENLNNLKNQQCIWSNYVSGCLDIKYGISMLQLVQIISNIISDYNLPYSVSYVCVNNYDKLTKVFKNDINFINQLFESMDSMQNEKNEEKKQNDKQYGPQMIMIGNYWRKIDNHRGGHWSPIINISSDHIYIADVSSHRIKPHWIKINDFMPLMFYRVKSTNLPRGYIRIFHQNLANFNPLSRLIIHKNNNIYIRMATNLDVLILAKIQVTAWKQAYRGIIDDEWLDSKSMTVVRKYGYWMEIFNDNYLISINQQPSRRYTVYKYVIVICQDNRVLGYCTVGKPGRSAMKKTLPILESHVKNTTIDGELYTLYLAQNCPRRQGFGGNLFDVGYDLIRNGFDFKTTVQLRAKEEAKINENDNDSNDDNDGNNKSKNCILVLWLLGDNQIAMKFYRKKGGIMVNDHERAHFGKKTYRYSSMVFGFKS